MFKVFFDNTFCTSLVVFFLLTSFEADDAELQFSILMLRVAPFLTVQFIPSANSSDMFSVISQALQAFMSILESFLFGNPHQFTN